MKITNWKMTYDKYTDLPCTSPCSMYGVLFEKGLIEDPFYGINETEATKLSDKGCTFESEFELGGETLEKEYVELEFFGIDTLCKISLNGHILANVRNMHRSYVYDIKPWAKKGKNTLTLDFYSPTKYFAEMQNKHHIYTSKEALSGAGHLRKAICMSGWDWGPKLPDMGIFRDVKLSAYDGDKIESIFVIQNHGENRVDLDISVETRHQKSHDAKINVDCQTVILKEGKGTVTIENPKLWWVRGYGEQNLYELTAELVCDDKVIDSKSQKIGLRTLTISTAPDKHGNEFCFVINGVKIFTMGANYIPQDSFYSRISPERTKKLLEACTDANFNCLRIWGGGWYPEDEFYDMCDEMGIMVWEDFMVACANIWLTDTMEEELRAEAICNIKRLRHHASLSLLCGNNEMEFIVEYWPQGKSELVRMDYLKLYEHILPDLCEKYAPQTFYWPSSPSSGGGFEDSGCESKGDVHYWSVWHGGLPFTDYRNHSFRFCSEYGFESYPSVKTIKTFCDEKDMNCFSRVMENHQKCRGGNAKILNYLASNYLYPTSFENLVYASQLLQADAIKYGVEHFRRIRGVCMGSLYWQINDCWPVASWSSVDYFGRYKALHYAAKKFYAPVALGMFLEDDVLTLNVSNETMNNFKGKIKLKVCNNSFDVIEAKETEFEINALSSKDVLSVDTKSYDKYSSYIYADMYDSDGNFIMRQTQLLTEPKYFSWQKPTITYKIIQTDEVTELEFTSDVFAKSVFVDFKGFDAVLSDNYFDITSHEPYRVKMDTKYDNSRIDENITLKTVYDIGK